jgi:hypothetical protein
MKTRIYLVEVGGSDEYLIRAQNRNQAIAYATRMTIRCNVASQDDCLFQAAKGTQVMDATAEPIATDTENTDD